MKCKWLIRFNSLIIENNVFIKWFVKQHELPSIKLIITSKVKNQNNLSQS